MYWSVPANARMTLSQIYLGNLQGALKSSEKAVSLDKTNPVRLFIFFSATTNSKIRLIISEYSHIKIPVS